MNGLFWMYNLKKLKKLLKDTDYIKTIQFHLIYYWMIYNILIDNLDNVD
jgi:hypothetical protein